MKYNFAVLSDKGNFRKSNQDNAQAIENRYGQFLAIVCDGMGGHAHGEVASKIAVDTFVTLFKNSDFTNISKEEMNKWLRLAIKRIQKEMLDYSDKHVEATDMGTTLTAVVVVDDKAYIVNVGDSRTFKFTGNKFKLITEDQNIYNSTAEKIRKEMMEAGEYPENFNERTYWKILTSALGPTKTIKIDTWHLNDSKGLYMLTSDGVHDYIDQETVSEIINDRSSLKSKAKEIIALAKSNLSTDNLSIILLEVSE